MADVDEDWLREEYVEKGRSIQSIADDTIVSYSTIRRRLIEYGWGPRDNSRSQHNRHTGVPFRTLKNGREVWEHQIDGESRTVQVSRLAAIAWYGYEAVSDNHVHHNPNIPWLNVEWAVFPMGEKDHNRHHGSDGGDALWRDEDWLREEYVQKGRTIRELSDEAGCSSATILKWLRDRGIETRPKSHRSK